MIAMKIVADSGRLEFSKTKIRGIFRSAGGEIKSRTVALLSTGNGGGRFYSGVGKSLYRPAKPGRYQASAAGQAPVKVSGRLAGSIVVRVFKSGEGVAIRSTQYYAVMLEAGAQGGAGAN